MKDLFIPLGLIAVVASMMFPMHPTAMDFLLVANLIFALTLLVSSLYVADSLKLSSLPTMLLLATLFRLALNVSSTRLILSTGEAGEVIEAFGKVMIQGNLIVGTVIFLVITLIQFIVIAKGSERVAEVSARFTLDALPGKQMSIDADVRAGLIDFATARDKRQELQTESRFYGALDGAMKFIKGDAIAGLVIIVINVLGGFIVGAVVQGLPLAQALSRYTLLSVGDGLVSQIPALLNSLAAGMVVTRVSKGNDESLAHELVSQLGQLNNVKLLIGVFSLIMAFMPGMPAVPFIGLALFLIAMGSLGLVREQQRAHAPAPVRFTPRTCPVLRVELPAGMLMKLRQTGDLLSMIEKFRDEIFQRWGLILALPELVDGTSVDQYTISMRGVRVTQWKSSAQGVECIGDLLRHFEALVEKRTAEFVDDGLTKRILDYVERELPELVSGVIPTIVSITQLSELMKQLVSEGIAVRNMDLILQAIAENGGKQGLRMMLEDVRIALRRVICAHYQSNEGTIEGFTLVPAMDLAFMQSEREGQPLNIEYVECIATALTEQSFRGILLVSRAARRAIRDCIGIRRVSVPVLAFEELTDDVRFVAHGVISPRENKGGAYDRIAA